MNAKEAANYVCAHICSTNHHICEDDQRALARLASQDTSKSIPLHNINFLIFIWLLLWLRIATIVSIKYPFWLDFNSQRNIYEKILNVLDNLQIEWCASFRKSLDLFYILTYIYILYFEIVQNLVRSPIPSCRFTAVE